MISSVGIRFIVASAERSWTLALALTIVPLYGGVAAAGTRTRLHHGVRLGPQHLPLTGVDAEYRQLKTER